MGAAGTDIAMEPADVVLMADRLKNIPLLLGLARHPRRVLTQNLAFATVVIFVLIAPRWGFVAVATRSHRPRRKHYNRLSVVADC